MNGEEKAEYQMISALMEGVIPPIGSKEFFRLESVRNRDMTI